MFPLRTPKREVGKRAGWGTDEVNSSVPQAPAAASTHKALEAKKVVKDADGTNQATSRHLLVEKGKVEREGKREREEEREREKAPEKGKIVELRKEENGHRETVEKSELYDEGCREILATEELTSSEEEDLWSNDGWLEDLMLELRSPEPWSGVPPEEGPVPEVSLGEGIGEAQREIEKRETEVEGGDREQSIGRETSEDQDLVAGLCGENRNFITIQLGGQTYKALFDPGAMLSLVGPRVAERFEDRLEDSATAVRNVSGGITRIMGVLNVMLEIDHQAKPLPMKALHNLDQEIILGMDFCKAFDVDAELGRGVCRVREGRWRPFARTGEEKNSVIHAECAGISELMEDERERVEKLVDRVLLYPAGRKAGVTTLTEHTIDVQGVTPFKHHPRRMSPKMQQVAIEEVERMFNEGVIERSASDYSSAPMMIRKSNGTYRFKLRQARYLTKIDLRQAYYQIPLDKASRKYTAFAVPGSGLWQFTRMPFGLMNAPSTFQRLIDTLFGPEMQPNVFGYLDDIIIATESFEDHLYWMEVVLKELVGAGLEVNREKCEFCCSQVSYLGLLLDREGLRPDSEKVAPVADYPVPKNVKQLRRFLGMLG